MNYNKLWKLLIDKHMKKKDLREAAGITTNTIAKMGKGGDVSTQVLRKICEALECNLSDLIEFLPNDPPTIDKDRQGRPIKTAEK